MRYKVLRNTRYDFAGESYASSYPNLHRYPATMIPQIGIELFSELNIKSGRMLDPYCGSGSSFIVGLNQGLKDMDGYDINPLAILISKAKFTLIDIKELEESAVALKNKLFEISFGATDFNFEIPDVFNINFWFPEISIKYLSIIKSLIGRVKNERIRNFFLVPFSETVRECSYTRNGEFKLFRIKEEDRKKFNPDVIGIFSSKLNKSIFSYKKYYRPILDGAKINLFPEQFKKEENYYDIVLTSPPYGDSRTTVAYGQFSVLANEWLGIQNARQIDNQLMGGKKSKIKYENGLIKKYINKISELSETRALEISSYYFDLENSIKDVSASVKKGGKIIYVVGNRMIKDVILPTDQFIAEKFEENGFRHILTYERSLNNKAMPSFNSPSNHIGEKRSTMTKEYIIVCEKPINIANLLVCDKSINIYTTDKTTHNRKINKKK